VSTEAKTLTSLQPHSTSSHLALYSERMHYSQQGPTLSLAIYHTEEAALQGRQYYRWIPEKREHILFRFANRQVVSSNGSRAKIE